MEKGKRKPKSPSNQYEFVSPFSLEECLARLQKTSINRIDDNTYNFVFEKFRLSGQLYRLDQHSTQITYKQGTFSSIPILIIGALLLVANLLFNSGIEKSIFIIVFLVFVIGLVAARTSQNKRNQRNMERVLAIFYPIEKRKPKDKYFFIPVPKSAARFVSPHDLNFCGVRLQRLNFLQPINQLATEVEVFQVTENEYSFTMDTNLSTLKVTGKLQRGNNGHTEIIAKIGFYAIDLLVIYLPLMFILWIFSAVISPSREIIYPRPTVTGAWFSVYTLLIFANYLWARRKIVFLLKDTFRPV